MPYLDGVYRWWRAGLSVAGLVTAGALLSLPEPAMVRDDGAAWTVIQTAIVVVVLWVPLFSWTQLVRDDRVGIFVGLVLLCGLAGAIAAIRWSVGDRTVPVALDIGLGYLPVMSAVIIIGLHADRRRLAKHQEWADPRGDRGLGWALLVLSTVVGVVVAGCCTAGSATEPMRPGRSELLPLPANLAVVSEKTDGGSGSSSRMFEVAARDGAPQAEVVRRLQRHLRHRKGWHLKADPAAESCRSLRMLVAIPVGEICVQLATYDSDVAVSVDFETHPGIDF